MHDHSSVIPVWLFQTGEKKMINCLILQIKFFCKMSILICLNGFLEHPAYFPVIQIDGMIYISIHRIDYRVP